MLKVKMLFQYSCISVAMLFLVACQPPEEPSKAKSDMTKQTQVVQELVTATVKYIDLEGGFFGLVTVDGQKLLPRNLAKEHRVDGTVLKFTMTPVEGVMTTQQWGTFVNLADVTLLKKVVDQRQL